MSDPDGMSKQERQRRDRPRRVVVLIVGIILLSLATWPSRSFTCDRRE